MTAVEDLELPVYEPEPEGRGMPPQDVAAEQAVLGACMIAARAIDDVLDCGLRREDFYRPAHEAMWDAIRGLHERREPVDMLTVTNEMGRLGTLGVLPKDEGAAYIHTCVDRTPLASTAPHYARIVREKATLRGLVRAGARVTELGFASGGGDVDELVNVAQLEVQRVADSRAGKRGVSLSDVADAALEAIEVGVQATPTPWAQLNHLIDGAVPGCMYATGARPGVGKTVFGVQWAFSHARHALSTDGPQVVYFTFEMSAARLYQRALATASGVDGKKIRKGILSDADMAAVYAADARLRKYPIVIEGASGWTPQQVRARARQLHRERPVGLIVVDHIGLTRAERSRDNRQAELSEAADVLLVTAQDLSASMHVLTQLNRGVTQRSDQRPVPSDIRDTDRIEQNADVVMLLHRDKDKDPSKLWVAVPKNRDGVEGTCELTFHGDTSRLEDHKWSPSNGAVD